MAGTAIDLRQRGAGECGLRCALTTALFSTAHQSQVVKHNAEGLLWSARCKEEDRWARWVIMGETGGVRISMEDGGSVESDV